MFWFTILCTQLCSKMVLVRILASNHIRFIVATVYFYYLVCLLTLLGAGAETTVATSSGHTLHITGTSASGKVVTTKLPLPANSKIVTVNVPTTQGGITGFIKSHLKVGERVYNAFSQCRHLFLSVCISGYVYICFLCLSSGPHLGHLRCVREVSLGPARYLNTIVNN